MYCSMNVFKHRLPLSPPNLWGFFRCSPAYAPVSEDFKPTTRQFFRSSPTPLLWRQLGNYLSSVEHQVIKAKPKNRSPIQES